MSQTDRPADAKMTIRSATVEATVIRCGCTDEQKASPAWHARLNKPCPRPRATEELGMVAYYHKNPLRRLWWRLRHPWTRGRVILHSAKEQRHV